SRGVAKRQKELLKSLFCRRVPSGFRPCGLSTCALTQAKLKVKTIIQKMSKLKDKVSKICVYLQIELKNCQY
ncbi:MAG TPA: hypothetical protein P5215_05610, partial [Bacteroidales bacterium]|nr:hypothetical protein [Bacteroidales bacterium]